jgi:hypothetical protein
MATGRRVLVALVAMVEGFLAPLGAQESIPRVPVRLILTHVAIDQETIEEAKAGVIRIYREAGVEVVWTGPGNTDDLGQSSFSVSPLLVLVRTDETAVRLGLPDGAFGMAQSTKEERGRVAFIFWNRVEKLAVKYMDYRVSRGNMLAIAISHELGHLLLPPGHSNVGLMKSDLEVREFILASRGKLLLSAKEGLLIRSRLTKATR